MAQTQRIDIKGFDEVVKEISLIKRSQLPVAISNSLNELAKMLRNNEMQEISETFTNLVSFTRKAPVYRQSKPENLSIRFLLRDRAGKGTAPDTYLAPQVTGGPVFVTGFTLKLRSQGKIGSGDYAAHWLANPKLTGGRLNAILHGMGAAGPTMRKQGPATQKAAGKYFILPTKGGKPTAKGKIGAIYERRGKELKQLIPIFNAPIVVQPKYDWSEKRIGGFADAKFVGLLSAALEKL
jgi:hypothetical protein